MGDSNPAATFSYVAKELGRKNIAFICTREARREDSLAPKLKEAFGGTYIGNEAFEAESAQAEIKAGHADAVAFGKAFIANPDLPKRFRKGSKLNRVNVSTIYTTGAEGYTDYPALP